MIKSAEEIQRMSVAGALTAKVLEALDEVVRPGISTAEMAGVLLLGHIAGSFELTE
ncbi:hypothetical protein ACLBWA_24195, partial [Pseudomonas aeruginosa]